MPKEKEESREFKERKELIKLQRAADLEKHTLKMEELEFIRENSKINHDLELTRQRIKSTEINRSINRKENMRFMRGYSKDLPQNP